jgi:integrase
MAEELLALRLDDIDFKASAGRVDEALDRKGVIGPCKNAAAYRTVWFIDAAGKKAMPGIKRFLAKNNVQAMPWSSYQARQANPSVRRTAEVPASSSRGSWFPQGWSNRRWDTDGVPPAVLRQQMGHTDARMTDLHGRDPAKRGLEGVFQAPRRVIGKYGKWSRCLNRCKLLILMERPMRIELTPEPWQGSVLPLY